MKNTISEAQPSVLTLLVLVLIMLVPITSVQASLQCDKRNVADEKILANVYRYNLELAPPEDAQVMEGLLVDRSNKPTAANMGFWARYFDSRSDVVYCFGPNEEGYVARGALALDTRHDCVSLLYRCSELARSDSLAQSINWALKTRFAGAPLDSFVGTSGKVNYDHPAHLDFSLDMIRTGLWGSDVTTALSGVVLDDKGTSRYPAGSFSYVASDSLVASELQEGDVLWLVLNPEHEKGAKLRNEYGLVIGHIGLVVLEDGAPWMVHAASSDLEGYYQGGTVVKVPLEVYLEKVDKFAGVMVTRFMGE